MKDVHEYFTWIDWAVIIGYLLLTTLVGHLKRGKQGTIRDFFLGGRSLPWQAVTGSIIATEISGVTFIGVAGGLFAMQGNFTYLIWGIGSILGRILVAKYFVPVFYEQEIYSPYDYMGRRLGLGVKKLATVVFTVGSILGQSVRVFVAAIPLAVVTPLPIHWCVCIIGVLAILWTLMGGMQTVIWTDVMQFFLFTFGGLLALGWIVSNSIGGWSEVWQTASLYGRTKTWDATWGFGAELQFTLWVAIFAVPFQNLTAFGVDQLNAQRMFCCRSQKDASKALIWSSVGQVLTLLMLLVGAALFVHYHNNPFTPAEGKVVMGMEQATVLEVKEKLATAELLGHSDARNVIDGKAQVVNEALLSNVPEPSKPDNVFPMWIVTVLPPGLSGLILAAIFAAAISSLDSILAALSQTTMSLMYHPEEKTDEELEKLNLVAKSRWLVVIWGILLTGFTLLLVQISEGIPLLSLAFGMTAYTMGPLLALFLCAMWGKGSLRGLLIGSVISFLLVMLVRTDIWVLVAKPHGDLVKALSQLPTYILAESGKLKSEYYFGWAWPATTAITMICGILIKGKKRSIVDSSE